MPSWWQNFKSTLASYYREYEFVTAIYVLEPWERRWANDVKLMSENLKWKTKQQIIRKV